MFPNATFFNRSSDDGTFGNETILISQAQEINRHCQTQVRKEKAIRTHSDFLKH